MNHFDGVYEKKFSTFCFVLIKVRQRVHHIVDKHGLILTLAIYGVQNGVTAKQHSPDTEGSKRYAGRWTLIYGVIKYDCKLLCFLWSDCGVCRTSTVKSYLD